MPTFTYKAANNQGEIINGELEVANKEAVISYLERQMLTIISIKQESDSNNRFKFSLFPSFSGEDKLVLVKHLFIIIKSGLSLKEGIETILNDSKNKTLKKIMTEAKFNLEKGQLLSVTFKKYPKYFSKVFIALLEAGEISGTLDKSLEYLGFQIEKEQKLKRNIISAMIYPAILIIASTIVISIFVVLIIPKLTKVFFQNNLELPWTTKLIMDISNFLNKNISIIILFLIVMFILLLLLKNKKFFKQTTANILLKVPVISDLYIKIILARFTRTLGTLLSSGISIIKALDISSEVLGYSHYRDKIQEIKKEVSGGSSIGLAIRKKGEYFPYLFINMISIGEKTGRLDSILQELANFYEEEVDSSIKNLISLLEPAILLIMGLIVAGIAFSVIMPIYQLTGNVV